MALSGGLEAVQDAVAATLVANLTAELDAVWTAAGDVATVPKPYPSGWTPDVQVGQSELQVDFPVLQVASLRARNPAPGPNWGEYVYQVQIDIWLQADSDALADRYTKRFLYAARKALVKHRTLDGSLAGFAGMLSVDAEDARAPKEGQQAGSLVVSLVCTEMDADY
jgi:hypothetical protein